MLKNFKNELLTLNKLEVSPNKYFSLLLLKIEQEEACVSECHAQTEGTCHLCTDVIPQVSSPHLARLTQFCYLPGAAGIWVSSHCFSECKKQKTEV